MENKNDELEIDLLGLLLYLKKKLWIIVAVAVLFAIGGFVVSNFFIAPTYTASTRMYVLNRSNETNVVASDFQISTYVLNDYKELIIGRNVTKEVIERLNLTGISPNGLAGKISVSSPTNTRVLQINVTDTDPKRAADIANTVREVAAVQIKDIMDVDAVKMVYAAEVPGGPSAPNVSRNTMLATIVGVALSVVVFAVIYLLDDTIRTEEDVEKRLGLTVMGVIPTSLELSASAAKAAPRTQNHGKTRAEKE